MVTQYNNTVCLYWYNDNFFTQVVFNFNCDIKISFENGEEDTDHKRLKRSHPGRFVIYKLNNQTNIIRLDPHPILSPTHKNQKIWS